MKRIVVVLGAVMTLVGCSSPRGSLSLSMERDSVPSVLPNFSREVQKTDDSETVRVEGFTQTSVGTRR